MVLVTPSLWPTQFLPPWYLWPKTNFEFYLGGESQVGITKSGSLQIFTKKAKIKVPYLFTAMGNHDHGAMSLLKSVKWH